MRGNRQRDPQGTSIAGWECAYSNKRLIMPSPVEDNEQWGISTRETDVKNIPASWRAIWVIGPSRVPHQWWDRDTGEFHLNPEYIEPSLPAEPAQYEQCLVCYELCEKVGNA